MEVSKYWLVHGQGPANFKHYSKLSASTEAQKLAKKFPHKVFTVLEVVDAFVAEAPIVNGVPIVEPGAQPIAAVHDLPDGALPVGVFDDLGAVWAYKANPYGFSGLFKNNPKAPQTVLNDKPTIAVDVENKK